MTLASLLDQLAPDVIERACACDRTAMEQLVSTMQRPFYNLALRMVGDRSLAEDAAQEWPEADPAPRLTDDPLRANGPIRPLRL